MFCALLSFLAAAACVRSALAPVPVDETEDKLAWLAEHGHEIDALILGASGTFHGLDPTVLDAELQTIRPEFKSFNLGVRGMLGLETDALLRRALELTGPRLELVVLEPKPFHPWTYRGAEEIARVQRWHTPRQTLRALRLSCERAVDGEPNALAWAWQHLQSGARRLASFGAADRLLAGLKGVESPAYFREPEHLDRWRGYLPIEVMEPPNAPARRRRFAEEQRESYDRFVARMASASSAPPESEPQTPHSLTPGARALADRQRAWLERRGLRVVVLAPPYVRTGQFEQILDSAAGYPRPLLFADPLQYPELYAHEARLDTQHLTAEAAAEFSRLAGIELARRLAEPAAETGR